ncbi:MAG: hypothetical protein FWD58_08095, partial [Firmicutes bacterium]|nr:hypothetical protein [Bacillota bacterium]
EAVATVAGGVITATGEGTATIYVVAGAYVGWCTVVVAPPTAISTVAEFLAIFELRTGGNNSANATTWASASNSSQTAATTKRASHYYLTADLDFANCRVGTTNYTAASPYPYTRPVTVNAEPQRYNAAGTDTDWNWSADATDQMYLDALGSPTQQGRLWFIDHQSFFNGTFDGRGYALKNITMSVDATGSVGVYGFSIFGVIGKSGVVKNVSFENFTCLQATATSTIAAQNAVVAHHNHGTIQDCYFSGVRINSKGGDAFGHNAVIAAFNYNKIDRCVVASAATSVSGTGATNYQRLYPTVVMTRRNGTSVGDVTNTFALMDLMAGTTLSIPGSSYTNGFTVTEFAAYPAKTINLLVTPLRPFDMRESTFNNLRMVWRSATTTLPTSDTSAGHCVRLSAANFTALSAGAYWTFPSGAMPKLVPAPAA